MSWIIFPFLGAGGGPGGVSLRGHALRGYGVVPAPNPLGDRNLCGNTASMREPRPEELLVTSTLR